MDIQHEKTPALIKLRDEITAELESRKTDTLITAKAEATKILESYGLTIDDLKKAPSTSKKKVSFKRGSVYKNPHGPELYEKGAWPEWIKKAIAEGHTPESMLVKSPNLPQNEKKDENVQGVASEAKPTATGSPPIPGMKEMPKMPGERPDATKGLFNR